MRGRWLRGFRCCRGRVCRIILGLSDCIRTGDDERQDQTARAANLVFHRLSCQRTNLQEELDFELICWTRHRVLQFFAQAR